MNNQANRWKTIFHALLAGYYSGREVGIIGWHTPFVGTIEQAYQARTLRIEEPTTKRHDGSYKACCVVTSNATDKLTLLAKELDKTGAVSIYIGFPPS